MVEMGKALNGYKLNNKEYPESLNYLEKSYPNGVPKDPFTKQPFTYKTDGQKFTLTCLGKDGVEGGEETNDLDIVVNEQGLVEAN